MSPKVKQNDASMAAEKNQQSSEASFCSEDFILKLTTALTNSFNMSIDRLVNSITSQFNRRVDVLETSIFDANTRIDGLENEIKKLKSENTNLHDELAVANAKVRSLTENYDTLEQYSRSDNLLIHGVPYLSEANEKLLDKTVIDMLNTNLPNLNLDPKDISIMHRTRISRQQSSQNGPPKPPPVVIRFTRRVVRNNILHRRRELKGKRVAISEQLTQNRAQLLQKAQDLITDNKIQNAWSQDGKILIKVNDNIRQIFSPADLQSIAS